VNNLHEASQIVEPRLLSCASARLLIWVPNGKRPRSGMGIDIGRAEAYVAFGELDGENVLACRVEEGGFWRHR